MRPNVGRDPNISRHDTMLAHYFAYVLAADQICERYTDPTGDLAV
jgi:hypothetical protein